VVTQLINRIGYDNSCFNIEFFVTSKGQVVLIEFNTSVAFQFVALFKARYVNNYLIEACRLALGEQPHLDAISHPQMASSCVLRVYEDKWVDKVPSAGEVQALIDAGLVHSARILAQPGTRLSDYKQDAYSFRYALFNIT